MISRLVGLILFAAFAKTCHAQLAAPDALALGEATVASQEVWGAAENPANAAPTNGVSARAYGFSHIGSIGLERFGLDVGYTKNASCVSLSVQHFAPPGYSLSSAHLNTSRSLADGLRVGIRVGVVTGNFKEYGNTLEPVAQVGVQYKVVGNLQAGAHYTYVSEAQLPLAEHRLRVGVDYASSPRVHLLLSATQVVGQTLAGGLGITYAAAEKLKFRAGIRTGGLAFNFGIETKLAERIKVLLTVVAYQDLPVGYGFGGYWE